MPRQKKLPAGMWKRGGVYYARFSKGGRLVRKRLSSDFDVAKKALNSLRARADQADFGILDNDYKWADLKVEFLRWAKQSVKDPAQYERHLGRFEEYMHLNSIRQIDHAFIVGFRTWRLAQTIRVPHAKKAVISKTKMITARTVNMEVNTLRAMLNKGVEWKKISSNPIAGIKPLADSSPRKQRRALSLEEVERLFEHAPDWLAPILRLFASTGMRRNELVELLFSDIDFEGRTLTVRASIAKSGKAREIPIDDESLAMLKQLQARARDRQPTRETPPGKLSRVHVFVTAANTPVRNNLLRSFYATCKRAGIEGAERGGSVDLHSLRVTFATLTLENGASPKAVQSILGHSTLGMTMSVYAKATEKAKRDAVAALPFAKVQAPDHVLSLERKAPESRTA